MAIGLGYDEQEMDHIPAESHDERVDWVLTPSAAIHCKA
jgi:5-formyltetrahydrofolate cyclo-ligase